MWRTYWHTNSSWAHWQPSHNWQLWNTIISVICLRIHQQLHQPVKTFTESRKETGREGDTRGEKASLIKWDFYFVQQIVHIMLLWEDYLFCSVRITCGKPIELKKVHLHDILQWISEHWFGDVQVKRHLEVSVKSGLNLVEIWEVFRRLGQWLSIFLARGPLKWSNAFLWPLVTGCTQCIRAGQPNSETFISMIFTDLSLNHPSFTMKFKDWRKVWKLT